MVEFKSSSQVIPYKEALSFMQQRIALIEQNKADEMIWFLEHENIITKGLNAKEDELLNPVFPVVATNRGGKYTFHGAGQRIIYTMLNLRKRNLGIDRLVFLLEELIIKSLKDFSIDAGRSDLGHGIFIEDKKIAALGLRVHKGITYHGISLNVCPNLENFKTIIPCGIRNGKVTSLKELGIITNYEEVDSLIKRYFNEIF